MTRTPDLERAIDELNNLLPMVVRDAERYRNTTELVTKSRELHLAAAALDRVIPYRSLASGQPVIRVRIGSSAVNALSFRKLPYDFLESIPGTAHPGEEHDLRYRNYVATDVFNTSHRQPVYGQHRYFDLATLGQTLEAGGELTVSER